MARLADYFVEVVAEPAEQQDDSYSFERKIVVRIPSNDYQDFALPNGVPYFCIPASKVLCNPSVHERKTTFFSFILTGGDGVHAYGFVLHFFEEYSTGVSNWRPRVLCLISHHPFFSLFKEIICSMYRSRYQTMMDSLVQTKIAHACEKFSWLVSPRHMPTLEQQRFSRGPIDRSNDSNLGWDVSPGKSSSTIGENYYRILSQLLQITTQPLLGKALSIRLHGRDFFRYHVHRGKAVHLDDYCFQMLFQCLSLKNVIYIVNCLLFEHRVLVHSNVRTCVSSLAVVATKRSCSCVVSASRPPNTHLRGVVCLAISIQLEACIHSVPACEVDRILAGKPTLNSVALHIATNKPLCCSLVNRKAPVPYFIGLHTSSLATRVGAEMFASCVVVHLDKDKVVSPIFSRVDDYSVDFILPRLPSNEVAAILGLLEGVVPSPIGHTPESPQHAFNAVNEVELTFDEGPLGITFESTHLRLLAACNFSPKHQLGGSAVVKSLPRLRNGLVGPAECSGLISIGSYLIGINGQSTLDLTFAETVDSLRHASRPIRLRFLNATFPYQNACKFAERLQGLSLVAVQAALENQFLSWVDTLRGAFATMFASMFCDYHRYIGVHRPESDTVSSGRYHALLTQEQYGHLRNSSALAVSVQFDANSFCSTVPSNRRFLLAFTQTQCFADFVNESVNGTRPCDATTPLGLFQECTHLIRESNNARAAIMLLFERDGSPVETVVIDLPMPSTEGDDVAEAFKQT